MNLGPFRLQLRGLLELIAALALLQGALKCALLAWDGWRFQSNFADGVGALSRDQREPALESFEAILARRADEPLSYEAVGRLRLLLGERETARTLFERMEQEARQDDDGHRAARAVGLGTVALLVASDQLPRTEESLHTALAQFEAAQRLQGRNADVLAPLGQTYYLLGRREEARQAFLDALAHGGSGSPDSLALAANGLGLVSADPAESYRAFQTAAQYRLRWLAPWQNRDHALGAWLFALARSGTPAELKAAYARAQDVQGQETVDYLFHHHRAVQKSDLTRPDVQRTRALLLMGMAAAAHRLGEKPEIVDQFLTNAGDAYADCPELPLLRLQLAVDRFAQSGFANRSLRVLAVQAFQRWAEFRERHRAHRAWFPPDPALLAVLHQGLALAMNSPPGELVATAELDQLDQALDRYEAVLKEGEAAGSLGADGERLRRAHDARRAVLADYRKVAASRLRPEAEESADHWAVARAQLEGLLALHDRARREPAAVRAFAPAELRYYLHLFLTPLSQVYRELAAARVMFERDAALARAVGDLVESGLELLRVPEAERTSVRNVRKRLEEGR